MSWGTGIIWGSSTTWSSGIIWGSNVVWTDSASWSQGIIWGSDYIGQDNGAGIIWGSGAGPDAQSTSWKDLSGSDALRAGRSSRGGRRKGRKSRKRLEGWKGWKGGPEGDLPLPLPAPCQLLPVCLSFAVPSSPRNSTEDPRRRWPPDSAGCSRGSRASSSTTQLPPPCLSE